ncbi:hypothetical protein ACFLS9_10845, partial [Bacteroidota bacterium]
MSPPNPSTDGWRASTTYPDGVMEMNSLGMAPSKVTKSESYEERYNLEIEAIQKLSKKNEDSKR